MNVKDLLKTCLGSGGLLITLSWCRLQLQQAAIFSQKASAAQCALPAQSQLATGR